MTSNKLSYWFLLGREPLLSLAELKSVLALTNSKAGFDFNPPFLVARADVDALELIRRLGGTIKIGVELGQDLSEQKLIETMVGELETVEGKINFGISVYNNQDAKTPSTTPSRLRSRASLGAGKLQVESWGKEIKKHLKAQDKSVRYVYNREATLSSVTVSKNGLDKRGREFLVTRISRINGKDYTDSNRFALAKTLAVQPFEDFSARDFGRPGRDDASGMLPPKLAMMMINIANDARAYGNTPLQRTILDPFCGSGTILTEALLLGYTNLIGSDISEKAIKDTTQNLEWTRRNLSILQSSNLALNIFTSDVRGLTEKIPKVSIDTIVTEPYLGPPLKGRETESEINKTISELGKLYCDAFGEFKKILKPHATVVFIIPRFKLRNVWHTISDKILPQIQKLGFTAEPLLPKELSRDPFLLYHRPGQFVGREIWKFVNISK
jgi:tRNA G10  N-methylase Trm11